MDRTSTVALILLVLVVGGVVAYEQYFGNIKFHPGNSNDAIFTVASSTGVTYFTVMADGKVGIGTEHPATSLEVAGQIRLTQKSSEGCSAATEGAIAYNPDNKSFWGCNGSMWRQLDN